jgi:ABC-2 type transport system permease protein
MRNIWTIAQKEFSQYFISPIAYAVAFLVLSVVGLIFVLNILSLSNNSFGASPPDSRPITGLLAFLLMMFTPALTMRLVADEVRMGTMELLLTAPLRDYELIIGKWLGAFLFILLLIVITLVFPFMINGLVKPSGIDQLQMMSGYLGLILVAAAFLALGVGISAVFSNQIAAFFTTMALFIVLWALIGAPASIIPTGTEIFRYLSMSMQFDDFNQGTISLSGIVYFLSLTSLGLFIGSTAVEIRRWR